MHTGQRYSLRAVINWTSRESGLFLLIAAVPTVLYTAAEWTWLAISWLPVALIGTAVAFITGFKNNLSYARLWEARQIWGSIVNSSRAWAVLVMDVVPDQDVRTRLFYRHLAWLTALRYQLREPRRWEHVHTADNAEYRRLHPVPEWSGSLEVELATLVDDPDLKYVLARRNRATHLIHLQSSDLRRNAEPSVAGELRHLELQRKLAEFLDAQGKCERIKNFPYPRQFATLNLIFIWMFIVLVPFGLLQEFQALGGASVWLTVPATVVVAWVFHTMDKIGSNSENPFEGGPNDVPITSICRTIEIDLREMLGEQSVPAPTQAVNDILM